MTKSEEHRGTNNVGALDIERDDYHRNIHSFPTRRASDLHTRATIEQRTKSEGERERERERERKTDRQI